MNINYETYKIFYYVAINGSVSKAAKQLLISQPAVTWHLKNLEINLGITLFTRTKKGVKLTDEGAIFFEFIKKGINQFTNGENALTNLKNLDYGIIRIGASTTVSKYVLMPFLEKFHEKYPNIEIEIINTLTEDLLKELRNGNLDILILNMPMKEQKDLDIKNIGKVQDAFVCSKKFYSKLKNVINLEDLNNYPLIFQKSPSNTREYLNRFLRNNNINLNPKMEIVSYNLIMEFVKSGFGIGYATLEFIKDELKNETLFKIETIPSIPKRYIGIITLKNSTPNYSTKKLIDLMTKKVGH